MLEDRGGNGNGGRHDLAVSPKSLEFGMVEVGSFASREVKVVNSGAIDLKIQLITFVGEEEAFQEAHALSGLSAGGENAIQVKFRPTSAGSKRGAMCILAHDHEDRNFHWLEISLSGHGSRAGGSTGLTRFIRAHRGSGRGPARWPMAKEDKFGLP